MGTLRQFCYCEHNEDSNGGGDLWGSMGTSLGRGVPD